MHWISQIILIFGLIFGHNQPQATPTPEVVQSAPIQEVYSLDATTTVLFEESNKFRNVPLVENQQLMKAAKYRADYFCYNKVEHFSPDGVNPWMFFTMAGYDYKNAGENIGIGYATPQEMQDAFVASHTHYANIINPDFSDVGMADECGHVVVLFGLRQN